MIIVSQDGTQIINFDNIQKIEAISDEIIVFYKGTESAGTNGTESVGLYKTEERAKEVLQEIVRRANEFSNDIRYAVYEMPERREDVKN